jgi:type II secretory pathway component GspD/PulD (secretin)
MSIQTVLNYLETEGDAISIANPNLVVASGQTATLFVGEVIPFRSTFQVSDFGRVTQRISNQNVGLSLTYSARADMSTGLVSLSVTPDLSSLQGITDIGPRTSNNNFTSNLVIPSGESFVVGGMLNDTTDSSENKLPILGDLPLIGKLFRSKRKTIDKSELIFIFTPTILDIYAKPIRFAGNVWPEEVQ